MFWRLNHQILRWQGLYVAIGSGLDRLARTDNVTIFHNLFKINMLQNQVPLTPTLKGQLTAPTEDKCLTINSLQKTLPLTIQITSSHQRQDDIFSLNPLTLNDFWYICKQKRSTRNPRSLQMKPVDCSLEQEPLPEKQVQASGLRVRSRPFSYFVNIVFWKLPHL